MRVEEFFMQQTFGRLFSAAETWIAVAYVAGMFMVLAFRSQQIQNPASFRISYILFAVYLIVPGCVNGLTTLLSLAEMQEREWLMILYQMGTVIGQLLLALAIVFALSSMQFGSSQHPYDQQDYGQ